MEFMEIPTIPKGVLDNLLASIGSSAILKEAAPHSRQSNGYGLLPGPLFNGTTMRPPAALLPKTSSGSLPPLPGRREPCGSPPDALLKDCLDAAGRSVGRPPAVKDKPKRTRKSRAGATTPKRKGISDLVLDANLEGAEQPPQVSPPKRRRPSAKLAENGGKPPPRKRNRSKAKAKDDHVLFSSPKETLFSQSDPTSSKGMLGVYGLETKPIDLTQYMKDNISLEGLLAGNFNMPTLPRKQSPPPSSVVDNSFGTHVSSILQNLTRSSSIDKPRVAPLFSKPIESKPPKFLFDLESTPLDECEESFRGSLSDNKIKAASFEAHTTSIQSRKTQDAPSVFSLETVPVIPPADFWNTLQIQPSMSLNALISQASATPDSRFFPSEMGSICEKSHTLPPSIFSLGSTQVPQESASDRAASSKLNHWFRAEPPKQDFPNILRVSASQGSKFPFKLDVEVSPLSMPTEKHGPKEGLFDIDLNKQSIEAEAAESVAHSTSVVFSRLDVGNESPVAEQARIDMDNTDGGSLFEHKSVGMDISVSVKEPATTSNIDSVMDVEVVAHVSNKGTCAPQEGNTGGPSEESSLVFVNKTQSFGPAKDAPMHVSTSLPTLSVPDAPETQEMCNDVPYSPGMQATARLLCRMAISSSPFYVEKDDRDDEHAHVAVSWNDISFEPPAKAVKVVSSVEKDGRVRKSPALHASRDKEYAHKVHTKDVKEKFLYSQMISNSTMAADKANGSEPWASTPPRHAPKNVASRVSGSQSSESDRSPCHGPREHTTNGNHGNTKSTQREQHAGAAGASRVSSSFTRKESRDLKGNHAPVSKTTSTHTLPVIKAPVSTLRKSSACETKQSSTPHGEGFTKISRPRSNTSKNCSQSQRSNTNGFPVQQPRNLNGCSMKSPSSRHVLPYVGEVRHGSK